MDAMLPKPPEAEPIMPLDLEPAYPGWLYKRELDKATGRVTKKLRPPKAPTAGMFETWAERDRERFNLRLMRYALDLDFYRQEQAAVFDLYQKGRDEAFVSTEPTTQIDKLCNMVGSIPPRVSYAFKTAKERAWAQDVEDWSQHLWAAWKQQHRGMGNGPLDWEILFSLAIYGVAIARITPDPTDPDLPEQFDLLDPTTCYWTPGGKWGLLRMSRIYQEKLFTVLDAYDPTGDEGIRAKYAKHTGKDKGDKQNVLDDGKLVTVREVWTRWHRSVSIDSMVIHESAHKYGRVPFCLYLMPGEMGNATTPETMPLAVPLTRRMVERGEWGSVNDEQWDLAMKAQSFYAGARSAIRYEEKLLGLLMTQVKLDTYPPQITTTPYDDDPTAVDLRPLGHTRRRPGEVTNPVLTQARAQAIGPLASYLQMAQEKALLPKNVFGVVEQSNVTGFAESTLIAAAKDKIQPYVDGRASFMEDCLELANYLFHGFAHIYVDDLDGKLTIPRRRRDPLMEMRRPKPPMPNWAGAAALGGGPMDVAGQMGVGFDGRPLPPQMPGSQGLSEREDDPPAVEIDREMLRGVGFRPTVRLEAFTWHQWATMANAAQVFMQGGVWSKWTARDKVGVEDPDFEEMMIRYEQAMDHPAMLEQVHIPAMLWKGGHFNEFLAWISFQMAQMGGAMGAPPEMPALPSGNGHQPGASVPGIQSAQGDSQPMLSPDGVPGRPRTGVEGQGLDVGP